MLCKESYAMCPIFSLFKHQDRSSVMTDLAIEPLLLYAGSLCTF
jgi:hypothetical protein